MKRNFYEAFFEEEEWVKGETSFYLFIFTTSSIHKRKWQLPSHNFINNSENVLNVKEKGK